MRAANAKSRSENLDDCFDNCKDMFKKVLKITRQ